MIQHANAVQIEPIIFTVPEVPEAAEAADLVVEVEAEVDEDKVTIFFCETNTNNKVYKRS
jgi:hypothetical protein